MAYYSGEQDANLAFTISLNKLDAAHSQITSAIFMYFHWGDPVAIHTLVAAAYGVLQDINKYKGGKPMTQDFDFIKDKKLKGSIIKIFREPQNFFKHADEDPEGNLDFFPYASAYMLFESIGIFQKLANHKSPLFEIFKAWFAIWGFEGNTFQTSLPSYNKFLEGLRIKYKAQDRFKYFDDEVHRRYPEGITLEGILGSLEASKS
jgi:hypothetical protein